MSISNKGFSSLCVVLITLAILFNGCEDPGSVGNEYVNSPTLTFDTLAIADFDPIGFSGYTGRLGNISVGKYEDQLFGNIQATGLIKPVRNPTIPDTVELGEDFRMALEIQLDSANTYGDTLSQSQFNLYEITSFWRSNAHRVNSSVDIDESNLIGSFSFTDEKVIHVNLSDSWRDSYYSFYDSEESNVDSLYNYSFGGLALLPEGNTNKVSFISAAATKFLFINDESSDTVKVSLKDWAYELDRNESDTGTITAPLHSTLENMISVTIPDSILRAQNRNRNFIRADIVIYEASELLESSLDNNHIRPDVNTLNLNLKAVSNPEYEYIFGQIDFLGRKDENKPLYKFDVTNYINNVVFGEETRQTLIIGSESGAGIMRSTLIYNETAPEHLKPKIVITSIVD